MKSQLIYYCETCREVFKIYTGDPTRIQFGKLPKAIESAMAHKCKQKEAA